MKSDLKQLFKRTVRSFKATLIHDITPESFKIFMLKLLLMECFAARLHDDTMNTFSRQNCFLIPKSNPF